MTSLLINHNKSLSLKSLLKSKRLIKSQSILIILILIVVLRSFTLTTPNTTTTNTITIYNNNNDNYYYKRKKKLLSSNRTIMFLHVGKTGGETIKWRLRISCNLRKSKRKRAKCLEQFAPLLQQQQQNQQQIQQNQQQIVEGSKDDHESELSKHTIGYIHCNLIKPNKHILNNNVTTLLFSIRNPIQRIISWYQMMHPTNCLLERPSAACNLKHKKKVKKKDVVDIGWQWGYDFYNICFPIFNDLLYSIQQQQQQHPSSTTIINNNNNNSSNSTSRGMIRTISSTSSSSMIAANTYNYTATDFTTGNNNNNNNNNNINCTKLAIDTIQGNGPKGPSNHLFFNYQYYMNQANISTNTKNKKEIFVIRQEYLFHDMKYIEHNLLYGISNRLFENEGPIVTHGSQFFPYHITVLSSSSSNSSTSTTSTIKEEEENNTKNNTKNTIIKHTTKLQDLKWLCCILYNEITIYIHLLQVATNLQYNEKLISLYQLQYQCSITNTSITNNNNNNNNNDNNIENDIDMILLQLSKQC